MEELDAFYKKHIEGKTWEEIDQEKWEIYSEWHTEAYGRRPQFYVFD